MRKKCFKCGEIFDSEILFCPICKCIGEIILDEDLVNGYNTARFAKPEDRCDKNYDDCDPPAPVTIYCKIMDVPYNTFRYGQGMGMYPSKLLQIENDIEDHRYNCSLCTNCYEDDGGILRCTIKKKLVQSDSICKFSL